LITLDTLNALPLSHFVTQLGAIFEHSPWVAERAAETRPFGSRLQLLETMRAVVLRAPIAEQLALIRAHPQLGARGTARAALTQASAREQRRAGLDAATPAELDELRRLNATYESRFGFPFILAVRGHDPTSILANLNERLVNDAEHERTTALSQIGLIAGYRLADAVSTPAASEVTVQRERLTRAAASPAALLREWMQAAGLTVTSLEGARLLGAHASERAGNHLLLGVYYDPVARTLRSDGRDGVLTSLAVIQELRQQGIAVPFDLLLLSRIAHEAPAAAVESTSGTALGAAAGNALSATAVSSVAPGAVFLSRPFELVRAAGVGAQGRTMVRQGPLFDASGASGALGRAAHTLESLLTVLIATEDI
jgi:beta-ureidopropionase / N-carbamoyl-L-amino-acid hydrolase